MSMLAERKVRTKWCLNPNGSFWSNDDSKFGQKILEKMGWSKGKGLGKDEDGLVDPIKVRMKHDNSGLGFKENGEVWTAHNEEFETVLKSLQEAVPQDTSKAHFSVSNMEIKSKKSKKRIHYHKFVRGKDLSKCSSKDFKSIFGKEEKFLSETQLINDKCDDDEHQHLNSNKNDKHQMVESTESERRIKIQKRNFNERDEITDSESADAIHKNPKKKKRKKSSSDLDLNGQTDDYTVQATGDVINSLSSEKKNKKSADSSEQSETISSAKNDTLCDSSTECLEKNSYECPCDDDSNYVVKTKNKKKEKKNKANELEDDSVKDILYNSSIDEMENSTCPPDGDNNHIIKIQKKDKKEKKNKTYELEVEYEQDKMFYNNSVEGMEKSTRASCTPDGDSNHVIKIKKKDKKEKESKTNEPEVEFENYNSLYSNSIEALSIEKSAHASCTPDGDSNHVIKIKKKEKKEKKSKMNEPELEFETDNILYNNSIEAADIEKRACASCTPDGDNNYVIRIKKKEKKEKKSKIDESKAGLEDVSTKEENNTVEPTKIEKHFQDRLDNKNSDCDERQSQVDYQAGVRKKKWKKKENEEKMKCSSSSSVDTQSDISPNLTSNAAENNNSNASVGFRESIGHSDGFRMQNKNITFTRNGQRSTWRNNAYENIRVDNYTESMLSYENPRRPVEQALFERWAKIAEAYVPSKALPQLRMQLNELNFIWSNDIIKTTNLHKLEGYPPS